MKLAILIPHRNDRPRFLRHLNYLILNQTLQPDLVHYVDYPPESAKKDITQRYRRGYNDLRGSGFDAIFFMEVDDWYASTYIETTMTAWIDAGKPDIFGQMETEYYHISKRGHFTMDHQQRSSAMSTLIKPDLDIKWCADDNPYTDICLFDQLPYRLFLPSPRISIGIKHGEGLTGGGMHIDGLERYLRNPDPEMKWLKEQVDTISFEFYRDYFTLGGQ